MSSATIQTMFGFSAAASGETQTSATRTERRRMGEPRRRGTNHREGPRAAGGENTEIKANTEKGRNQFFSLCLSSSVNPSRLAEGTSSAPLWFILLSSSAFHARSVHHTKSRHATHCTVVTHKYIS